MSEVSNASAQDVRKTGRCTAPHPLFGLVVAAALVGLAAYAGPKAVAKLPQLATEANGLLR